MFMYQKSQTVAQKNTGWNVELYGSMSEERSRSRGRRWRESAVYMWCSNDRPHPTNLSFSTQQHASGQLPCVFVSVGGCGQHVTCLIYFLTACKREIAEGQKHNTFSALSVLCFTKIIYLIWTIFYVQSENEIKIHVNNLCTVKRKLLMPNTITKNLSGYEIFMQIWINTLKHTTKYLL